MCARPYRRGAASLYHGVTFRRRRVSDCQCRASLQCDRVLGHYAKETAEMARLPGITASQGGLRVKLAYFFTERVLAKLAGRAPAETVTALGMYAYLPGVLTAYGRLEQATNNLGLVDNRVRYLAELKAATMTGCEYCMDLGSQIARRAGLSDEKLLAMPNYRTSDLFTEQEKLVMDYAVGMCRTPAEVPDDLFARMREQFSDAQIVELTHVIALENMRGRFNRALGISSAGYSEGMVCVLPVPAAAAHSPAPPAR
jgi:AhpD family alkylhydroperoxidase